MHARSIGWIALLQGAAAIGQTLPEVTISTTRTEAAPFDVPASVNVIAGQRLRGASRPEINLSEGLATVPGLSCADRSPPCTATPRAACFSSSPKKAKARR